MITPGLDIAAYARRHRVRFVRKDRSRLMRAIGWLLWYLRGYNFLRRSWTTIGRTVYYPVTGPPNPGVRDSDALYERRACTMWDFINTSDNRSTIEHELYHVEQFRRLWHLHSLLWLLFPLPFGLAWYRWRCERVAYLHQLRHYGDPGDKAPTHRAGGALHLGRADVERVVGVLWRVYGWCWPRPLMRRWFARRLADG